MNAQNCAKMVINSNYIRKIFVVKCELKTGDLTKLKSEDKAQAKD